MMSPARGVVRYAAVWMIAALGIALAFFTTSFAFNEIGVRSTHSRATIAAVLAQHDAFVALVDQESAVRGYVATADPAFLEPYRAGRTAYTAYRAHARNLGDPALDAAVARFVRSADALAPFFARQIAMVRHDDRTRAVASFRGQKVAFDRVRRDQAAAMAALTSSYAGDRQANAAAIALGRRLLIAMSLVLVLGGVLSTIVTVRARASETLARRDDLTHLPNRRAFEERLQGALSTAAHSPFAVLSVDLDRFKPVNDDFGHVAGDTVLTACAERLRGAVRPDDFVARVGGDEFCAILPGAELKDARAIASRIASEMERSFEVGGTSVRVGASIGIAVVPDDGVERTAIVRVADEMMYEEKRARRTARS